MSVKEKLVDVFTHLGEHIQNRDEYGICYTSDFAEAVEEVLKMLKNSVTVQEWISVEDRPPEENARVWVFCDGRTEVMIYRRDAYGECRFYWEDELGLLSAWYKYRVTHWMPLPAAPED